MSETEKYTEAEALDIAVMLFVRKARRAMGEEAYTKVLSQLPEGAREALMLSELRGDDQRDAVGGGFTAEWPTRFEDDDEDDDK